MIVSVVAGCDNVEWEGAWIRLQAPPSAAILADAEADTTGAEPTGPTLPDGPVLFVALRDSTGMRVVPVGEIAGDSILPLPTETRRPGFGAAFARARMAAGAEFALLAGSGRVGTFYADDLTTDTTFCRERPAATGVAEVMPEAADRTRFLAVEAVPGEPWPRGGYASASVDRGHDVFSLNLTGRVIPTVGARWPTSLPAARARLDALRLDPDARDAFAATFLFRDRVGVREAEGGAYALFLMGVEAEEDGFETAYVWYRDADRDGRGVPLLLTHADWDRDGEDEVLLEVLGSETRWTAGLDRIEGEWRRVWQDPCGGAPPAPATAEPE